jgi:hypothetical protein
MRYCDAMLIMKPVTTPMTTLGFVFVLAVAGSVPARADIWCVHDSAGITSPICAFSSAQDCVRAAIVGPSGMVCSQGNAGPPRSAGKNKAGKGSAAQVNR